MIAQSIEEFELLTEDGKTLAAFFVMNKYRKVNQPSIILLHGGGRSKEIWNGRGTTKRLYDEGYNVLAFDIRGNGRSDPQTPGNFVYPYADFQAALDWLKNNEKVNSGKIGAMGSSYGSNILAAGGQMFDWNLDAIVTLSATAVALRVMEGQNLKYPLKSIFFIACENELLRYDATNVAIKLHDMAVDDKDILIIPGRLHGSSIYPQVEEEVIDWFNKHLK